MDLKAYKLGQILAIKQAGFGSNALGLAKDVGSGLSGVLKSKNPWVTNALWGAGGTAGMNALLAPKGHKMEAAAKGVVPGAVGGLAWHGLTSGIGRLAGSPEVGGAVPGWGKSIKALSGLDPSLSRGQALGSLARRSAPTIGAMAVQPSLFRAMGVNFNPQTSDYKQSEPQEQQYLQQSPYLAG